MAGKRRYEDGCAFAQGLDLVGERWALLVIRELVFGPKRFTDIKRDLSGIATNVLSQRLTDLEEAGVILRRDLPPPARATVYDLTAWGRELVPVFKVMGRWAARSPHLRGGLPLSVNAALLSLTAMFRPGRSKGFEAALEMRFDGLPFTVTVAGRQLAVEPGHHPDPQVVITGDQNILLHVVYMRLPLDEAMAQGLRIEGDMAVMERFATLFPMPQPAPLGAD